MTVDAVGKGRYRHSVVMVMVADGRRKVDVDRDACGRWRRAGPMRRLLISHHDTTVHLKSTNKHVNGGIHFGKTHLTNIVLWSKEGNCPTGGMAQFRILAEKRPSIAEHFTY